MCLARFPVFTESKRVIKFDAPDFIVTAAFVKESYVVR
jgi:hypothetical protein